MSNSTPTCEFAHLYESCSEPADFDVKYRWWGQMLLCDQHFREMNAATDKHVLGVAQLPSRMGSECRGAD